MNRRPVLALLVLALMGLSAAAGYYLQQSQQAVVDRAGPGPEPVARTPDRADIAGTLRPDFSLPDLDGNLRSVSEWQGKVIAVNFWATWCPPCLTEIPEFVQLQTAYGGRGLQFIGIALQGADEVRDFVRVHGMNYPVLTGELEAIRLAERLGNHFGGLPYTVFIDREGKIRFVKAGALSREEAEAAITALL